jgi:hypothetical protein
MEFRNGILLQLIECIESTQNEVKRKMIKADACNAVPKSPARLAREKKFTLTRALVILIYEMIRLDAQCGIAALCQGGENAVAMAGEH